MSTDRGGADDGGPPDPTQKTGDGHRKQVDGGELGTFNQFQLDLRFGDTELILCHLLATGETTGTQPALDGTPMAPNTEYWIFHTRTWGILLDCYRDPSSYPDLRIHVSYRGPEKSFKSAAPDEQAVFEAPEYTTWDAVETTSWPSGSLAFSSRQESTEVRGFAFESTSTGDQNAVWWAQISKSNIPPSALDGMVFYATQATTGAAYYASSSLLRT